MKVENVSIRIRYEFWVLVELPQFLAIFERMLVYKLLHIDANLHHKFRLWKVVDSIQEGLSD